MSTEASWFYVFDSARILWLRQDDAGKYDFGSYAGAAEFQSYEEAREAAVVCIAKTPRLNGDLIVLADHGLVEVG